MPKKISLKTKKKFWFTGGNEAVGREIQFGVHGSWQIRDDYGEKYLEYLKCMRLLKCDDPNSYFFLIIFINMKNF